MWPIFAVVLLAGTQSSLVATGPGESLAVTVTVTGSGPWVVFVPPLCGGAFSFRKPVEAAEGAGLAAVVVEPLGFGHSSRPAEADYSLTAQSARIAAVLDRLGVGNAILVGQGVTTAIVFRLALARPDLVRGIVSLGGGAAESAATPSLARAMKFAGLLKLAGPGLLRKRMDQELRNAAGERAWVTEEIVTGYAGKSLEDFAGTVDVLRAMTRSREPEPLRPRLSRITCPVELLLGGEPYEGSIPAEELAALRAGLPELRVVTVTGAGAFIAEERPDAVLVSIRRVLRRALDNPVAEATQASAPGTQER